MKLLIVFGTRPEAIKMAPLVNQLKNANGLIDFRVCVTAQHREMLDQVLDFFDIAPNYDLNIMSKGQDLFDVTMKVMEGMKKVISDYNPDYVLVHGDTSTTFATALSAFYLGKKVAHIEAGLRTWNRFNPWPEEMNRKFTGYMADIHFAPTELSKMNLIAEKVSDSDIIVTGNTVIDALLMVSNKLKDSGSDRAKVDLLLTELGILNSDISNWATGKRRMVLITCHRRENFGSPFVGICSAINKLSDLYKEVDFVFPVHKNPNILNIVNKEIGYKKEHNIKLIEPLDYLTFIRLMSLSHIILTDSGGVQEEAPSLGKPVLVMRETTERPEAIETGVVKLVGTNPFKIVESVSELLLDSSAYNKMASKNNPYGNGDSSEKIINWFLKKLI